MFNKEKVRNILFYDHFIPRFSTNRTRGSQVLIKMLIILLSKVSLGVILPFPVNYS